VNRILTSKWTKVVVFLLCLVPAGNLVWLAVHALSQGLPVETYLSANPIEFVTHRTGDWLLRFIVITLAITPLRRLLKMPLLIRFRRMLGLFAFFYGCLHFSTWMVLDKFFDWSDMWADVHKRPFITVGFLGFLLMVPLAITSTAGWIRRLGGKRWQMLHRAIYVTAIAGVIHYYWLVKSDVHKPVEYGLLVGVLLLFRLWDAMMGRRKQLATGRAGRPEPTTAESA
jgi:methionine sulfoxide reductase heme-binding subunit